jgi:hypothetical protein
VNHGAGCALQQETYQERTFSRMFTSSTPGGDAALNTDRSSGEGFYTARSIRSTKSTRSPARPAPPSETDAYASTPYFLTPRVHDAPVGNPLDWDQLSDDDPLGPSELSDHWLLQAVASLADPFGLLVRCVVPAACR